MTINRKIFNENRDYNNPNIFIGEEPGLFDTVNKLYPKIWKLYKTMKSLDWDENEFDYSSCNADFKNCDKNTYDMMIKTLAWQWEADSVASKSIASIMSNFVTSSEVWAGWQRISDNEVVHAATYSEIVRSSFDDPNVIIDEILSVKESVSRLETVAEVFAHAHELSHKYALDEYISTVEVYDAAFMFTVALYILERIQFMSSFAITFAICDTGLFGSIGKAVQKIAQDELEVHCAFGKEVLRLEMLTLRGQKAFKRNRKHIDKLLDEVIKTEFEWTDYLFSEGRSLVGLNPDILKKWILYNSKEVYNFFGIRANITLPRDNPLKYMEHWLNISKIQPSPQEEDVAAYKVGIVRRDDEKIEFDLDF